MGTDFDDMTELSHPVLEARHLASGQLSAAQIATQNPYFNPRPVTRDGIRRLLEDAYQGRRPD